MKKLFFICIILTGVLISCQDKTSSYDEELKYALADDNGEVACIEMIFPVTYIMPDGSTITCENKRERKAAFKRWYSANPGSKERPSLQFPVDVNFKGSLKTIRNIEEMKRIREVCKKDRKPCFQFIYPITFTMPDGSTIICNSREDRKAVRMWYREHPGVTERPSLQYPLEVKFGGKVITINNEDEMKRIKNACQKGRKRCFVLIFPVTYIMPDGTEITITGKYDKEGWLAIKTWYTANPGNNEKHTLQYPVEVKYKDGTVKTINNREEMIRAKKDCK